MRQSRFWFLIEVCLLAVADATAAVHYVDVNSVNPTPPYADWSTAATNIQDAVDAAGPGDQVLVTNGLYQSGGRAVEGTMTNRVAVTKAVTLQSVNGPQFTSILGYQIAGTTNGDGAIRCVYLTNGATLIGFTLTNGATRTDGAYPNAQNGGGAFCESTNALITNCVFIGNSAAWGGGGAYGGILTGCTFSGNSTDSGGGGAASATLNNCALFANSALYGGAAYNSTLNNCTVTGNWTAGYQGAGGGVRTCTVNNCILYYNSFTDPSGRASPDNYASSFPINYSCTTPPADGLGVGNISAEPKLASASRLSAASPCRGAGNPAYSSGTDIDGELWANPPSVGCDEYHAGTATGALAVAISISPSTVVTGSPATFPAFFPVTLTGTIEGQATANLWDFGDGTVSSNQPYSSHAWSSPGDYALMLRAYNDSYPDGISTTVVVHVVPQFVYYVSAGNSAPLASYNSWATAATNIQDAVDVALPGSLVLVTNGIYRTGGRQNGGINSRVALSQPLTIQSINGPEFTRIEGGFGARCVYLVNQSFLSGFTLTNGNLGTFSGGIGGGVAFADSSSDAVLSNCVIVGCSGVVGGGAGSSTALAKSPRITGGTLVNCKLLSNSARGLSGGFPFQGAFGGGAIGCTLINCLLSNNFASGPTAAAAGGGASSCRLQSCTLISNSVVRGSGGGAAGGTLVNCLLVGNSGAGGGGAAGGSLSNCTVVANSSTTEGGGVIGGALYNCIVYGNSASSNANYTSASTLNFSCTTPQPGSGVGNITNAPLFVDTNGWANLRLQSNSPCINAGDNAYVFGRADLDGRPRIVGGTVDMGAYEFHQPFDDWLQQYGLPTDGSADYSDSDNDHMNNWQEWIAGTDPTNALSALRLLNPSPGPSGTVVTWESVTNRSYFLESARNLGVAPSFSLVSSNIVGQASTTSYTDTNAPGPFFYRVGVQP